MWSALAALARLIAGSRRAVVLTGAGISTESGIPDFRSPGAALAVVNRDPTRLDGLADAVVNRSIGEALGAVVGIQ